MFDALGETAMGETFWAIDWNGVFIPRLSVLELFLRGTIMYLVLFVLLRLVHKRQVGGIGTSDVLVIVLLAEVAGNGFTSDYKSLPEGAILVATVLFWSFSVEWLQHRFPFLERLLREPKLKLIEDGRMLRKNMKSELVTVDELMAQLREKGVEECSKVESAYMEADGRISVIKQQE